MGEGVSRRCAECARDIPVWYDTDFCGTACALAWGRDRARDPDPIRELLAFMIARELHAVCTCGAPGTRVSDKSMRYAACDACAAKLPEFDDWKDLPHAAAIRRLVTP